jgi:hypothetical protein
MNCYEGILIVNTKMNKGLQLEDVVSFGKSPKGFYRERKLYSPRYGHPL